MKNDPKKLLIIIRHGERTDRVGEIPKCGILNPELTEKGKNQSFLTSKILIKTIFKYGIKTISPNIIQIRTSPYIRTIQTAVQISKGFNLFFKEENLNNENLNNIYIDFDLKKRIKPNKKINKNEFLYKTIENYINFDPELKGFNYLGDKGEFSLEPETKEQCEKRSFDYTENILKNNIEKNNDKKIFIIIGHRGCLKYILKKLGYKAIINNKKILDYCSQFFFDISNGLDKAIFLENISKPNLE
jgi:phosphohistidine phosphatase SixA